MADRYENIRKALARLDSAPADETMTLAAARDDFDSECDPDTIRALLKERDVLEALLIAYMQAITKIDDRAEYILPMPSETRSELHAILAGLAAKLAAIDQARGRGDGNG